MERDGVHIVCLGVEMDEGEAFLQDTVLTLEGQTSVVLR